jgi:hypothetical protein
MFLGTVHGLCEFSAIAGRSCLIDGFIYFMNNYCGPVKCASELIEF